MEKNRLERRVREMLDVLWLGEFEARRRHQLSGGQPQRVDLARALVNDPKALLLDSSPRSTGSRGWSSRECCAVPWRDADRGDFVADLEASRHDPAVRPGASLWLDWRSDAWRLLDPDAAPNAATPNVAKHARRRQLSAVRTRSSGYP